MCNYQQVPHMYGIEEKISRYIKYTLLEILHGGRSLSMSPLSLPSLLRFLYEFFHFFLLQNPRESVPLLPSNNQMY